MTLLPEGDIVHRKEQNWAGRLGSAIAEAVGWGMPATVPDLGPVMPSLTREACAQGG